MEFELLWGVFPNKSNKLGGFKAWQKHIKPEDREELFDHVRQRASDDARWASGFIPHLQSFINGARWEDDYPRIDKRTKFDKRYYDQETEEQPHAPVDAAIAKRHIQETLVMLGKGKVH